MEETIWKKKLFYYSYHSLFVYTQQVIPPSSLVVSSGSLTFSWAFILSFSFSHQSCLSPKYLEFIFIFPSSLLACNHFSLMWLPLVSIQILLFPSQHSPFSIPLQTKLFKVWVEFQHPNVTQYPVRFYMICSLSTFHPYLRPFCFSNLWACPYWISLVSFSLMNFLLFINFF